MRRAIRARSNHVLGLALLALVAACPASGGSHDSGTTAGTSGASEIDASTPMAGSMSLMGADAGCAGPEGQFQVEYTYVSGNCPALVASHPITLGASRVGVSEIQMNRVNDKVELIVVYMGCQIALTYKVLTKPDEEAVIPSMLISSVEGDLDVQSETTLSGTVTLMQFDPPGTPSCQGEYAVTLTKNETTIGTSTN